VSAFIDLDMTLTEERTIAVVDRGLGLGGRIEEVLRLNVPEIEKSKMIISLLMGKDIGEIVRMASKTQLSPCSRELIEYLLDRGFEVQIVTLSYKQVAEAVLKKITDRWREVKIRAPLIEVSSGKVVGVSFEESEPIETPWCVHCPLCKRRVAHSGKRHPSIAIGDSLPDICMFLEADISILIDRGSVPEDLKKYASRRAPDICSALEILSSVLKGVDQSGMD